MAPSRKRDTATYTSDDGFVEDDDAPSTKRSKTSSAKASKSRSAPHTSGSVSASASGAQVDDNGDPYWDLSASGSRRVTVNNFKGKTMVNIREYYEKDGAKLPGKKGISLPMEQFAAFVEALPGIDRLLRERGEEPPKVRYEEGAGGTLREPGEGGTASGQEEMDEDGEDKKRNFEATSEED